MSLWRKLRARWSPADPSELGVREGRLASCPAKPNCVSSRAERSRQRVAPLATNGDPDEALRRGREILLSWPRTRIVDEKEGEYVHAECRTLLGFVDDLELLLDRVEGVIHLRSASRLGYQDFGVNRERVERLRTELARGSQNSEGRRQN